MEEEERIKKLWIFPLVLLLFGFSNIVLNFLVTVEKKSQIGSIDVSANGLNVSLIRRDHYTLTYFEVEEDELNKHYLTFVYEVTLHHDLSDKTFYVELVNDDVVIHEQRHTSEGYRNG